MDDPEDVSSRGGIYQILRGDKNLKLQVTPGVVQLDSKPSLQKLDDHTALVTLSSFRSEYFDDAAWKKFVTEWKPYSKLIVDLRENAGGNLVSMLRALSPLFCRPSVIGDLSLPRKTEGEKEVLVNDLSDDQQIDEMDSSSGIILKTFEGYGCYRGSVAVLIGPHTSSVSEIFAAAMMHRPNTRVMGQPTSGDVVLAVWYDLPTWGRGYSISIPEALYLTREGKPLEGRGVFPQQEVFDDLKVWRQGRDSWIQAARAARF
jgi:C-terminal processing protease CtpA/Prc